MIGEMWWTRMVNAVRFLGDALDYLETGKSVILNFPDAVPWIDILASELELRLARATDSKTFEIHDVANEDSPGEYLFRRFCSEAERQNYWPTTHRSYERFLAANPNTPLKHRFLCITGVSSGNADTWVRSISEYLENCDPDEEHGIFILITCGANVRSSERIECFQYSDYVTDYDCMMLCLTKISSLSCSRTQKLYLSEVASSIANNNVEIAGMLVSAELELIRNPMKTVVEIFNNNNIKYTKVEDVINTSVWEAQIKHVFPRLEHFRREIIQKYENRLKKYLPISSSTGERIDKAIDIEIGPLYTLCYKNKIAEKGELNLLGKMRDARNALAHLDFLSYNKLQELGIF